VSAILVIIAVIVIAMVAGGVLHSTYFRHIYTQIAPYGRLVSVGTGKMHVYSTGSGETTIVLLPGLGVGLPSADFGPLMRSLGKKYTVVCVEYFGVGFSSPASTPRTSDTYVEEIRSALAGAGFKPPFVLMPHSISSVYSEYYAEKYPAEVKAIVSLDGTSTAFYKKLPGVVNAVLPIARIQQASGFTALLASLAVNKKTLLQMGYTEKEIHDIVSFSGFSMNSTIIEQIRNSAEFIRETMSMEYPETVPYFKIISKATYETPNKQLGTSPQEYQRNHLARLGKNARFEILNGTHFIYLTNAERITEITDSFLAEIDTQSSKEV